MAAFNAVLVDNATRPWMFDDGSGHASRPVGRDFNPLHQPHARLLSWHSPPLPQGLALPLTPPMHATACRGP